MNSLTILTMENHVTLDPSQDGINHLNVYSRGKTPLGRFLSNFAHTPLETEDGHFESMEGYIYYLMADDGQEREQLRSLHGSAAKKLGKELASQEFGSTTDEFKAKICSALTQKVMANPDMWRQLRDNKLPFLHYYVMYGRVIDPNNFGWTREHLLKLAATPEALAA